MQWIQFRNVIFEVVHQRRSLLIGNNGFSIGVAVAWVRILRRSILSFPSSRTNTVSDITFSSNASLSGLCFFSMAAIFSHFRYKEGCRKAPFQSFAVSLGLLDQQRTGLIAALGYQGVTSSFITSFKRINVWSRGVLGCPNTVCVSCATAENLR